MKPLSALPLLALAGCSVCQPTRFTWPVFYDPIAALIMASDSGSGQARLPTGSDGASEPATSGPAPATAPNEQPSAPAAETPSVPSQPATETPATQTPSTPSASDGVGGQQETREESHDRG